MKNEAHIKNKYFFRTAAGNFCLAAMLLLVSVCALRFGSAEMTAEQFFSALIFKEGFETQSLILFSVRLPRIAAGLLSGIGFSVSGVLLQKVTDNYLASPNIIGVNAGAGFGVALFLSFFPQLTALLPLAAFGGAVITTLVIIALGQKNGSSKSTVILAGIAVTTLLNAAISFLNLLDSDVLASYNAFSVGSISGAEFKEMAAPAVIIALSLGVSLVLSRKTDLLCLGDPCAKSLGVNTAALRFVLIVCASASAAAAVSFAGLLGFVGLVVPHIARKLVGNSTKHMLVCSVFTGSATVILADLFGRTAAAPSEIPVGITMALIGAPFFLWLLLKRRKFGEVRE